MQDFSNACRLCLKPDKFLVNCLDLEELSEFVENVFRFKILKEDKFSTKICRECVTKVTKISMYIDSVQFNQRSIKQFQALQSKISEIPKSVKCENDDDDVIFISEGQLEKSSHASTSTEEDKVQVTSSQSSVVIRKATARKSTSKPPISAPAKKPKLVTKFLKVVCPVLDEKDVGDVYLSKEHRNILKLNGKRRTASTSNRDTTKLVPPIRLKLSTLLPAKNGSKNQNSEISVMKIVNSPQKPAPTVQLSPSKQSDDDRPLTEIRQELTRSILRRSLPMKPCNNKVIFRVQPDQRSSLPGTSGIAKNQITATGKSADNRKTKKLPTQHPADSTATSPPPASAELPKSTPAKPISTKTFDSGIIVSIPPNTFPVVSSIPQSSVIYLSGNGIPFYGNPTSNIKTFNTALNFTTPLTVIPTATAKNSSNFNFNISNPRSVIHQTPNCHLDEYIPVESLFQKNTTVGQKPVEDVAKTDHDPKVKILTVNELNMRVDSNVNDDSCERGPHKLPIRITLIRVRNEIVIKLEDSNKRDVHHSQLSETERSAVRSTLLSQTSKKHFEAATQTCRADKQTMELLKVLGMEEVIANNKI